MWADRDLGVEGCPEAPRQDGPAASAGEARATGFLDRLAAAGGGIERFVGEVEFRATLDQERGTVIFSARCGSGPWPIAYAEAFHDVGEAFFEGWCMDAAQWIEGTDSAEAALALSGGELVDREAALRSASPPSLQETAADFWVRRPSRRRGLPG